MAVRPPFLLAAAVLALLQVAPAAADLVIELKDGRRFVLPLRPEEVARTFFTPEVAVPDRLQPLSPRPAGADAGRPRFRVGPGAEFRTPSEAARVVPDGAVVEIEAGVYHDLALWRQSDLVIRGVDGRPIVDGGGRGYAGKAVWVIAGRGVLVENVEITGAAVPDHNGAAIRAEGGDLTLRRASLHGNEMGILVSRDFAGTVRIEDSEIFDNRVDHERFGVPPGHNIYVSGGDRFELIGSWIHSPRSGHNIKSRARENDIRCNRIEDGRGAGSYAIDIAEAAPTRILGNLLRQGPRAENHTILAFGTEAPGTRGTPLLVAFNTFENALSDGLFVRVGGEAIAVFRNNLVLGAGRLLEGEAVAEGNLRFADTGEAGLDPSTFTPLPTSAAVDAARGVSELPECSYRAPVGTLPRRQHGRAADVGAFEAQE